MYIIIGFAFFFSLCFCIGNRTTSCPPHTQHLASCLYRSQHPAVPIHTSKLSVYLLETKHAEHIVASSHFPIFKSIPLLFLLVATQIQGFISTQKDHCLELCLATTEIKHGTHAQKGFIPFQPCLMLKFFSKSHQLF